MNITDKLREESGISDPYYLEVCRLFGRRIFDDMMSIINSREAHRDINRRVIGYCHE